MRHCTIKGFTLIENNDRGFSLIEVLVAAAVVAVSLFSVVAFVRKGNDMASIDRDRRVAREIVDTTLEGQRFLPANYDLIPGTITSNSVTLYNGLTATRSFTIDTTGVIAGVNYKTIAVKVQWLEPGASANDFVQIERWVPDIQDSLRNIASLVTNIVASSGSATASNVYDGIDSLDNGVGEWVSTQTSPNITLTWAAAHRIKRIFLYDRTDPSEGTAGTATINFNDGKPNITIVIPAHHSKTVDFIPRSTSQIQINLAGSGPANVGLAEVEVYE
jgi:prepilin-type N-terminal cleavage/methylation domain-containing protein